MTNRIERCAEKSAPLIGVAPLMRLAFRGDDLRPIGAALMARASADAADANAMLDFSTVLQLTGDRAGALAVQHEAIRAQQHYSIPTKAPERTSMILLVLMGPGDLMANTPVEFLVEDLDVALELLYVGLDTPWPDVLPEHDLLMVAVGESDANQPLLAQLAGKLANWPRPVINAPERIAVLSRDGACTALRDIPGICMPLTSRASREDLAAVASGAKHLQQLLWDGSFPLIARPIGSHAGQSLEKIETPVDLLDYLSRVIGDTFYISRFVDYRSEDGQFRKYRIVLIDGAPYICHMAISSHWMVHYLNAGMDESAEKRHAEAECMANFELQFARKHAKALAEIGKRIGLSYVGIDCAEAPNGDLLVFEVDNAMVVHSMDPEDRYAYKKPIMQKLFRAFRTMLRLAPYTAR